MDYDEVRRIHRLEKNSSQLSEVKNEFFLELKVFLAKEREKYFADLENRSISRARDYPNLEQMVREIVAIRERKILNKALIASRTKEFSLDGMTKKEQELFDSLLEVLNDFKKEINGLFESKQKKAKAKEKDLKKLSLQILSDIPSFIGADMKEYGPFSKDQIVELPRKTAELLVERKLALKK